MSISRRSAVWNDMAAVLALGEQNHSIAAWKPLIGHPSFISVVLEADPPIRGHKLIGFACAVMVSSHFLDAELANPQPDILSRLLAGIPTGASVLPGRGEIARANAGAGIDLVTPHATWRDAILSETERYDVQMNLVGGFTDLIRGYRVHRYLQETSSEHNNAFIERSPEHRLVASFPSLGRAIYLMNRESGTALSGSVGNQIFRFNEPQLRLRESDQELLLVALNGATDVELAAQMNITLAAVKARWRSAYARIAEVRPDLVAEDADNGDGRGGQKRHRVLTYVRNHMEELRPYDPRAVSK